MRRPIVAGLVLGGLIALWAGSALAGDEPMKRTITVSATGTTTAVPDEARISSGVVTEADTAKGALAANSAAMTSLIDGLKAAGIDANDIQTSSFGVEPRYTRPREGEPAQINGYRVVNQVSVLVRNLDRLGEILDRVVALGANQLGSLTFEVSEIETLRDAARKDAIANARRRAELYAAAAGVKVGDVVSIVEGASGGPPVPYRASRTAFDGAVPIERGTETLSADVTVTWELER